MTDRRRRARHAPKKGTVTAIGICLRWVFTAAPSGARNLAIGQLAGTVGAVGVVVASAALFHGLLSARSLGTTSVLLPLFGFAIFGSVTTLIANVSSQRQRLISELVERHVWKRLIDTASNVDLIIYETQGFSTHLARVEQNALSRPLPTVRAIFGLLGSGLTALAMGIVLLTFNPVLPLILLSAAVPSVLIGRAVSRSEYGFGRRVIPIYMRRGYLRSVLTQREHAEEIRALGAQTSLQERHQQLSDTMVAALRSQIRARTQLTVAAAAVAASALILVLVAVVLLVDAGQLSLSRAGAAAIAARLFASSLTAAYGTYGSILEAAPHVVDLQEFMDLPVRKRLGVRSMLSSELVLSNVSFAYPSATSKAVDGVDLRIGRGEVVALVGENGSGKTTLARLVAGLYEPDTGLVIWDGKQSDGHDRTASTSLLPQRFGRFAFSVADNISLGDTTRATEPEETRKAARRARFDHIAMALPDGYDTVLGRELDEGTDLSGGQWQRLALARALFRDTNVVVLDEPSSALDPRAESELFDDVRSVLAGRSALLISHRFASARLADRIYVLHSGRVVESGTHAELMSLGGRYEELFSLQSSAFLAGVSWNDTF